MNKLNPLFNLFKGSVFYGLKYKFRPLSNYPIFEDEEKQNELILKCKHLNTLNKYVIFHYTSNGSLHIELNNQTKKNAMNIQMYNSIADIVNFSSNNPLIKRIIFKGNGNVYCAGNDLSFMWKQSSKDIESLIKCSIESMDNYINSLIDFDKTLIAVVDGPAIGIGCSTLGLFDLIIATSKAKFSVPFSKIALAPEGCSSYTFPLILGLMRANQMLLFNHKLTGEQALEWGFIGYLIKDESNLKKFLIEFENQANSEFNTNSLILTKRLIRTKESKKKLKEINIVESQILQKCWLQPEYRKYLEKFYGKSQNKI